MCSLAKLQHEFVASMKDPHTSNFIHYLRSHPTLTPVTQLTLYQNNIIASLQKALKSIYPTCQKLVGEAFFTGMMNHYIDRYASTTSSHLNLYGEAFPDFITTYAPAHALPYLSDVARFEWAWHCLYTAPDSEPFDFEKLAANYARHPAHVSLLLPPASVLMKSPYPIQLIYETNLADYKGDTTITLHTGETYCYLIWRHNLTRRIDLLSPAQWRALTWVQAGVSFQAICEKLAIFFPQISTVELLPELVKMGWICDSFVSVSYPPARFYTYIQSDFN